MSLRSSVPLFTLLFSGAPVLGFQAGAADPAFVENRGQWDAPARFVARRGALVLRLEDDALALRLPGSTAAEGHVLRLVFEGAPANARIEPEIRLPGLHAFFLGDDPARWRTALPGHAAVAYRGILEGVDIRVREGEAGFEYDLLLAAGSSLDRVEIRCEGASRLRTEADGSLVLETPVGEVLQPRPVAWEEGENGARRFREVSYRLCGPDRFGFEAPDRDLDAALVVDPGLVFSTFLGGSGADPAFGVASDEGGAAVVVGYTTSSTFPTTAGAFDTTANGTADAFVARLAAAGDALVYSTYLGGSSWDEARSVALDATGAATVAGSTQSSNFPTTAGAFGTTANGDFDVFVTRLSPSGAILSYSTLLGGVTTDEARGVALDGAGSATVAGYTFSSNFPTTAGAFDTTFNGAFDDDAFVARLSPTGASLVFSTFLGGISGDEGTAVALHASGATVVAGRTLSFDFPTTAGAFDSTYNGSWDAFVARLSPGGDALEFSTFLGTGTGDEAWALGLDPSGAPIAAGRTESLFFPTTAGAFDTTYGGGFFDAFVTRFSPSGATLLYSTFLGGVSDDEAWGLAVDPARAATVVGFTGSANFPATTGAFDTTFNGSGGFGDAYAARLSPAGNAPYYATFLGGTALDVAEGVALDASGFGTAVGWTGSSNFPVSAGAFDTTYNGGNRDAFASRLDFLPAGASAYGASTPGCAGALAIGVTSIPKVGNASFAVTCANAPPSATGLLLLAAAPLSTPLPVLGVGVWIDLSVFLLSLASPSNAVGAALIALPIPADASLAGSRFAAQFFWFGPNSPSPPCPATGFSSSNALSLVVQP